MNARTRQGIGVASGAGLRQARDRTRQRIQAGPVMPYGRADTQDKRGQGGMTAKERRDLRRQLADLNERIGVLKGLIDIAYSSDENVRRVPDDEVPARARKAAHVAALTASDSLGIDAPDVAFFAGSAVWAGYAPTGDNVILLNAERSPEQLVSIAAHECAHVAGQPHPAADQFAHRFAAAYTQRILDAV